MVVWESEKVRLDSRFNELWPITRSITGRGFRRSLEILQQDVPLKSEAVSSGTDVLDWQVPPEWNIHEARLTGPDGQVYADLDETNLAVVNYTDSVDEQLFLEELDPHLYTLPEVPDATPYVTSYYERNWGFCLPHNVYESLPEGEYHAYIDSEHSAGELTYGHTVLEGESDYEVLLSSYLCHPSLANNELSGPLALTSLYNCIRSWEDKRFTYRFVVVPETIGSITYLSRYGEHLKDKLVGGLVLTCLGGPRDTLSYKMTRRGDTLIDQLVHHLDGSTGTDFRFRQFGPTDGGSDERQYCSPGFDLPVGQFARTVYGEYDEYHTSKDTKGFMKIEKVLESVKTIAAVLRSFERAGYYRNTEPFGEPMLSKRDLYRTVNDPSNWFGDDEDNSAEGSISESELVNRMMLLLQYSDGDHSAIDIAERYGVSVDELAPAIDRLREAGLLEPEIHTDHSSNFQIGEGTV